MITKASVLTRRLAAAVAFFAAATVSNPCASTIAVFDQHAYQNATTLKAEASSIMELATEPYSAHEAEARAFMTRVNAAYEYAGGLPKNQLSADQWAGLTGPNLLGGFFALWKGKGVLVPGDITAQKKNVMDAFSEIIRLEGAKIR